MLARRFELMLARVRKLRSVAGTVALAIVAVASANCLAAQTRTAAERACCAAMAHHCNEPAMQATCCHEVPQTGDSVVALNATILTAPAPSVLALLDFPLDASRAFFDGSSIPVRPPGTRTYVLVSAFRI